jgi:3-oxoacyl-[acyl-carrier protein] reductase
VAATDLAGRTAVVTGGEPPRSIEEGADTAVWLTGRVGTLSAPPPTGRLWEDRVEVPW